MRNVVMPSDFVPQKIHTVSELNAHVKGLIEAGFDAVWVRGEISNFKTYPSGHHYFTLKDAGAQVSAVMFKGMSRLLKFRPEDGMGILARGRLTLYEARGQYQMVVDHLEPDGVGALQVAFEQLKKKLDQEGLFDQARKRPLPFLPRCVGVVTSQAGAAIHDILTVIQKRFGGMAVQLFPVKVQGEGAASEIARALDYFSGSGTVDVVILGRGGGSLEDLWAFNEEAVARAIFNCQVPVVSAVGHETDFTIADFVADVRAPTPTAAAHQVVPSKLKLLARIEALRFSLLQKTRSRLQFMRQSVRERARRIPSPLKLWQAWRLRLVDREDHLYQSVVLGIRRERLKLNGMRQLLRGPQNDIALFKKNLERIELEFKNAGERLLLQHQHRLSQNRLQLELLSPKKILQRGYVIAKRPDGKVLPRREELKPDDKLKLVFYDGETDVVVEHDK